MLDNSRGVFIQGNAKGINSAADTYVCDRIIQYNSRIPRYISPPIISKFPKWTETHKLERTEIRLEIMIESLREHRFITNPVEYVWCAKECQRCVSNNLDIAAIFSEATIHRFNDETKLLLQLAEKKGLFDLKFKSKVQKHVTEVKQLMDRVKVRTAHHASQIWG